MKLAPPSLVALSLRGLLFIIGGVGTKSLGRLMVGVTFYRGSESSCAPTGYTHADTSFLDSNPCEHVFASSP